MRISHFACSSLLAIALLPASPAAQQIDSRPVAARSLPREVAYRGAVIAAQRWSDRLGENLILLTRTDEFPNPSGEGNDQEMYAYHYVRRDSGYSLLWRTTDFVRECFVDLLMELSPQTLEITDLDGDGIAETTFMYMLGCRGGLDPAGLKLIMHEGATKYAIRGTTELSAVTAAEYGRSVMRIDPAFARAPTAFREFAVRHWRRFVSESAW